MIRHMKPHRKSPRRFVALGITAGAVALAGCGTNYLVADVVGSGTIVTQDRAVDGLDSVTGVELSGSGDVTITIDPDAALSLTIIADDNLLDVLRTEVKDNKLFINFEGSVSPSTKPQINITVGSLSNASLRGSGRILVTSVSGESFTANVSGSGDIIVDGTVDRVEVKISGSGNVELSKLTAKDAAVAVSGSGDVAVHATQSLDVKISGSGDVVCHGSPAAVTRKIAGSGDVTVK